MAYVVMCETYSHTNFVDIFHDDVQLVDKQPVIVFAKEESAIEYLDRLYNNTSLYLTGYWRGTDSNENHKQFISKDNKTEKIYVYRRVTER